MKPTNHKEDHQNAHTILFEHDDALLLVDPQRDFCPGGALPVETGDRVIEKLNDLIKRAADAGIPIAASRDAHPPNHCSFEEQGGPWPAHCVYDTPGCDFHPCLNIPLDAIVVSKGESQDRDNYSAFDETDLAQRLRDRGVKRVIVGGLALDVCVRHTCHDAINEGFHTVLVTDATAPADPDQRAAVIAELKDHGVNTAELTTAAEA